MNEYDNYDTEMSMTQKLMHGITMFRKYGFDEEFSSKNQSIYIGPDPRIITEKDKQHLLTLGFYEWEDENCFVFHCN